MTRETILTGLRARVADGGSIVVAGVGSGLTAAGAVAGGADLIATYSTAIYRILGVPTALAFRPSDHTNRVTLDLLPEVVGRSGDVPVIAGLGAHDPRRPIDRLVGAALDGGATGLTNEPFVGIYTSEMRADLDRAGYGFSREVAMLAAARRRGMLTLGWAFDAEEVRALLDVGVDVVGAMAGITSGGTAESARRAAFDDFASMVAAARAADPDAIVVLHGGPLSEPAVVGEALAYTGADGYATGSSAERTPVLAAVREAVAAFRALPLRPRAG
jgi:predicted TIM-barrel enzyme